MRSQLLKVSAIVLAGALSAPLTYAQEEADAEAPPPPTPQEIAAENLDQLLNLVKQGQARASSKTLRGRPVLPRTKPIRLPH